MSRIHPTVDKRSGDQYKEQRTYYRSMSADDAVDSIGPTSGGRRRTWTLRSNAARQMAVNFMPSRRNNTIRLRHDNSEEIELLERLASVEPTPEDEVEGAGVTVELQAEVIVREMEQDQDLMEDNPEAEELRREALRELPQCLTMKRNVRAKISASVSLKSKHKPIPFSKRLKYRISFGIKRMKERFKNFFFSIELWYEAIRTVEGNFGSAVGSYFYFLRWLFIMNIILSVFIVSFIVIPQILYNEGVTNNTTSVGMTDDAVHPVVARNTFLDLLSGQGMFEDSVMFYGHYHSGSISSSTHYDMAYAYFFTMVLLYMFFFVVLSIKTAWSYRRNFIETAGGLGHVYASKVFCGWDFGIATSQAAALNSRSIYNELKELLSEQYKKVSKPTACAKATQFCIDLMINVLVLALIGGILTLFWWLLDGSVQTWHTTAYGSLTMAFIVTVILAVCPLIFSHIVRLESYGPRTSLYVTLARTFLLDASTMLLLMIYWLRRDVGCWETMLAQEIYRLIVLDIVFSIVLIPLFEFIRGLLYKKFFPAHGLEFDIAYNSLCLVYNQALLWLGMLFSPPLVALVSVKLFVMFYVRRGVLLRVCRPARKVWRAAQTQTVLHMLVYLSITGTLFVFGYVFMRTSSNQCGPFQQYHFIYQVFTEGVLNLSHHSHLQSVLGFITRPGVIAFALLFMCVAVYYMRAKSIAHKSMVAILREMLILEAKDKEFLLSAIDKVSNGEWMYSPKPDSTAHDNSHTWKYLHDDNIRKPSNAGFHFGRADNTYHEPIVMNGRPKSHVGPATHLGSPAHVGPIDHRPNSYFMADRPNSYHRSPSKRQEDGDSDSSFSWQGSGYLNKDGNKKWL